MAAKLAWSKKVLTYGCSARALITPGSVLPQRWLPSSLRSPKILPQACSPLPLHDKYTFCHELKDKKKEEKA